MLTAKEVLQKKVSLTVECVDRVYLNGYVKYLQMPGGVVNFIREEKNWAIPSPQMMKKMSEAFRREVKEFAKSKEIPLVTFGRGDNKAEVAKEHLAHHSGQNGVVLIGIAQEKALGYKSRKENKDGKVWFHYSRQKVYVTHYYFYIWDENFGLTFIKVCTYFPFDIKVYFNGHEWAKQQLRQEGIGFEALENGFAVCDNPERLQEICHSLNAEKIRAFFDYWVEELPWPLDAGNRSAGYSHNLSVWQLEVSHTQVFTDPAQGRALVEDIIRDNLNIGRPDRVSLLFDRRVTKATPSEFYTRVIQHGVLPSIRICYKHSALKLYFKDGRAMRIETMINNARDFYINKGLMKNWDTLVKLGHKINHRMLENLLVSQDCFLPLDTLRAIGKPTKLKNGQRASAMHFADQRVMALMATLARHIYIISTMTNKSLRESVALLMGLEPDEYPSAKMSYDLRRLRLKGLLERIPHSHAYSLTDLGLKVAVFFTKLEQHLFKPGLSALLSDQHYPSALANALTLVAQEIQVLSDAALIFPIQEAA